MRWSLGFLIAATVAVAGCAGGGYPTGQDEDFLARLGETVESGRGPGLVAAGRAVCDRLRPVNTLDEFTAAQVSIRADFPGAVDTFGIVAFEDVATAVYCPDVAAGLGSKLEAEMQAEIAAVEEQARRVDEEFGLQPPVIGSSPGSQLVVPEGCIGYGCGPGQDEELGRWERGANSGG